MWMKIMHLHKNSVKQAHFTDDKMEVQVNKHFTKETQQVANVSVFSKVSDSQARIHDGKYHLPLCLYISGLTLSCFCAYF